MSEADRMRAARQLFERAQRDNVTMEEARRRIHAERYEALAEKMGRANAVGLCGTAAPRPAPVQTPRQPQWWQRD